MKKLFVLGALAAMLASGTALADTSGKKIAFSNNYAGNSWRQAMLDSYGIVTKKAVADKVVGAADIFTTADKEVPTQAAQVQNLILQGYDAIVINSASPDALNGAIKQACDAGITVVSFDGTVTEPCAYRVVVDFKDMGKQEVEQMAKFQPKGGNLLEIRGLAGTSIDDAIAVEHRLPPRIAGVVVGKGDLLATGVGQCRARREHRGKGAQDEQFLHVLILPDVYCCSSCRF